jgi:hypothetical protein
VKDVIPFVEKTYRVIANKDNRAIAGLSMGGGHTLMATNNNPGAFGYIGVFSSGPRTVDEAYEQQLEAVKAGGVKFYWTGAGTTDMAREGTMNLHSLLEARFQNVVQRSGSHYWFLWRDFWPIWVDSVSLVGSRENAMQRRHFSNRSPGGRGRWHLRLSGPSVGRTGLDTPPPPQCGRMFHSYARLRRRKGGPPDCRQRSRPGQSEMEKRRAFRPLGEDRSSRPDEPDPAKQSSAAPSASAS